MVNQVEYHPRMTQKDLHAFCQQHAIQLEAWSPLMQGQLLDDAELQEIADKHGKSVAQVILHSNYKMALSPFQNRQKKIVLQKMQLFLI